MKIVIVGKHNLMNWPETVYHTLRSEHDCQLFITNRFTLGRCLHRKKDRHDYMAGLLEKQLKAFKPDVVLCISPCFLSYSILQACRSAEKALFTAWIADNFDVSEDLKKLRFDALFYTDSGFRWKTQQICPSFYLPLCANPNIFHPASRPAYREPFFVGVANPERIAYLAACQTPCTIYGKGWDKKVLAQHHVFNKKLTLQQASEFVRESLCPFNMSFSSNNVNGLNFRVFELGAARKLILTNAAKDLERCYHIGTEALAYSSPEEFSDLTAKIIRNPSRYEDIAQAGYDRTLHEHTYIQRMHQWLNIVQKL